MSAFSEDLLEQAETLLKADLRKPKQANVRRAVSAAYYGLFHFLIEESTLLVVNTDFSSKRLRQIVARAFTHTAMNETSKSFASGNLPALYDSLLTGASLPSELKRIAAAFDDLQRDRHRADYDLSSPMSRQDSINAVQQVRSAIKDWNILKQNNKDMARLYATCLLLWGNLKGRK